jgi:putative nucleotidyltransferase with HDIG domain
MGISETAAGGVSSSEQPPSRVRILFVDDEPDVLKVLRLAMRPMAHAWDTHFAESGEEALGLIEKQPFDVVVSDMRMPGMNGAQLLNHVLRKHPRTARIILSGYSDLEDAMSCVGVVHQFLRKPCSLVDLRASLQRISEINSQLGNLAVRTLAARVSSLPSLPELYLEIMDAIQSPNASVQRIADIAARDPALSAKLLQISNSAYFGVGQKVFSVSEAVQLLGVGVIQSLALAVPLFTAFDQSKCPTFPLEQVWDHSAHTGALARRIASEFLEDYQMAEQAFAAGVLHDIGKLILADGMPEEYAAILAAARARTKPLFVVEREVLGASHADIGAYLLTLWSLPLPLVEAVAHHHEPGRARTTEFNLIGVIHVANSLQREAAGNASIGPSPMDERFLEAMGVTGHLDCWRKQFLEGAGG